MIMQGLFIIIFSVSSNTKLLNCLRVMTFKVRQTGAISLSIDFVPIIEFKALAMGDDLYIKLYKEGHDPRGSYLLTRCTFEG